MQGNNFQIDKIPLLELPLHKPSTNVQNDFVFIVDKILEKKDAAKDTTLEEQQIDRMVYKLYDLTYDEVLVVDPETPIGREEYRMARQ